MDSVMSAKKTRIRPFVVRDCALAAIATGRRAQNLRELRDHLCAAHVGCIYYHSRGGLLRPRFAGPADSNGCASWAGPASHDQTCADPIGS